MKNKKTLEENRNEIRIGEMTVELIYPKKRENDSRMYIEYPKAKNKIGEQSSGGKKIKIPIRK